jgi:hypothetical protein
MSIIYYKIYAHTPEITTKYCGIEDGIKLSSKKIVLVRLLFIFSFSFFHSLGREKEKGREK